MCHFHGFSTKSVPNLHDSSNNMIVLGPKIRAIRGPPVFSKKIFLPTKCLKKNPQKLLRKTQIHFFSLLPWDSQAAQTEKFMFQNVAYAPTLYRIGVAEVSKFKWVWPHLVDLAFGSTQYSNQVQMMKCPRRANLATKAKVPASLSFPIFWPQFLHIIPPYIYLPFLFYLANIFEVIASRLQYLHLDMDAMQDF